MLAEHRIYWFVMIFAPLFCFLFFMDLLKDGLPKKLPVAVVDEDNTTFSGAFVEHVCPDGCGDAHGKFQRGPGGFTTR